ncbi:sterol desaturase family protein [Pseudooceanicola sp.]|uniref:sterol desaturase family protein n=1 Tax=Pseudooceanicola sp. TaxID=1914328 RepID=UPI00260862D1|nr:sterol desaturase family protein [Pseudooceanicola sp.]MDF1855062.1 sterol desaturase family protein [Pseudooceanicola sp.]
MILALITSYWLVFLALIAAVELAENRAGQRGSAKRRWPANIALIAISSGLAAAIPLGAFVAADWAQRHDFGLLNLLDPGTVVLAGLSFVLLSLWDYLVHLASHKIPLLWRFHKIHHSDKALDVTTTYRVHPVIHVALTIVNAAMAAGLGLHPGTVMFYAAAVLIIDLSHHTALRIPDALDRKIRPFVMTPALHHIHHSDQTAETDSNYGHDLAIWDRLFGTYRAEPLRDPKVFRYGLRQFPEDRANNLHDLLKAPFRGGPFS